jgi:hypothetical protein
MYKWMLLSLLIACLPPILHAESYQAKQEYWDSIKPIPKKPITIMVHGSSLFCRYIPLLKEQATTPEGIKHLKDVSNFYHYARLIRTLSESAPEKFPTQNMYLFGWSGALSFAERANAGDKLYEFLAYLKNDPVLQDTSITVITVSHGGGVTLNSAACAQRVHDNRCLVDRLILLCCPIQLATQEYAHSPTFKQVIHYYSRYDFMQIMDPQGLYNQGNANWQAGEIFSDRIFPCIYPTITQVELNSNQSKLGHLDFIFPGFHKKLAKIIDCIESEEQRNALNKNRHGHYCLDISSL